MEVREKSDPITLYQTKNFSFGLGKRRVSDFQKVSKNMPTNLALLNVDPHSHCVCGSLLLSRQEGIYIDCANHCADPNHSMGWNLLQVNMQFMCLLCSRHFRGIGVKQVAFLRDSEDPSMESEAWV